MSSSDVSEPLENFQQVLVAFRRGEVLGEKAFKWLNNGLATALDCRLSTKTCVHVPKRHIDQQEKEQWEGLSCWHR